MARLISEINQEIINQIQADPVLSTELTSTSKVSNWRLWSYIMAVAAWTQEKIYDLLKIEVSAIIADMKPHTTRWYASKAKSFQYGHDLVVESDYYDNTGLTESEISASKIISNAAVLELERGLRIKVAKDNGADLAPLSSDELTAFIAYMQVIKDAGVKLNITSTVADSLKLKLDIYYNPILMSNTGSYLDGSDNEPVQKAIKNYLKNLPFNGVFLLQNLVDVLQTVSGVKIINVVSAQAKYGALPFTAFAVKYTPDAGYLRFANDADLVLTYIPYSE